MKHTDPKNTSSLSQTPFEIPIRRDLRWDFSDVPADFVKGGNPLISYLWAALSAGATPIESFFIKALLPTLETIEADEKLLKDVRDMIAQEALHSSVHNKLNKRLESQGYNIKAVQENFAEVLGKMTKGLDAVGMLGVVAAGEHSLYSFAKIWFQCPEMRHDMHEQAARVFHWHFLEEAEHGAVSHDQYRYFAHNNYWHRLKTAYQARYVFSMITDAMDIMAEGFGYKPTLKDRLGLFYYKWFKPGLFRLMAFRMMEYLSPWYALTFEHDDIELMRKWSEDVYADQPAA
ncbi:metal-dependent hydrolase [uncultured Zhongshania sp.]|uniref:metal-dependent hydrolase n=1 Tax=uncultured Zhongshania sp. TaxID=1642288 RepID=UPI0030D880A0|tara:strand:+ start:479 stop:1345 length:867 start_codon:yes stop_codon:yes gene_type:complete